MIEALNEFDTQWFYLINHHHCTVMDWVMWFFSSKWSWFLAMVIAYLAVAIKNSRFSPFTLHFEKWWWLPLVAIGLCFLFADQTSNWIKDWVCRERPCKALADVVMYHTKCGHPYGFVSSHAANALALVAFFWFRYGKTRKWVALGLLVWALITCYSRPYLGKHYPGDVVCGALLGILMGYLVYLICRWIEKKLPNSETKK
jgi:undecaprenyl-diphosphatase